MESILLTAFLITILCAFVFTIKNTKRSARARGMIETEGKLTSERADCKKCGNKTEFRVEIRTYSDSRQWVTATCIKCDTIIVLRRTKEVYSEPHLCFHCSGITPEEEEIDQASDDKEVGEE